MDIISALITRVEDYRATNKNPCKNYGTQAAAQAATGKAAQQAADHFAKDSSKPADPCRYVVFYVPAWGRWVGALDYTELLGRSTSTGGYLGCMRGWYTY